MCDVDLPRPFEDASAGDDEAAADHHSPIDERDGVSRNENKQIGGVRESVVPRCDPVDHIVWDVIEKDRPVRDSAKHIEPVVAALRGQVDVG